MVVSQSAEDELRERGAGSFADLLLAAGEAVIATTPEGVVLGWNHHAETLYGWTAQEAVGNNIVDLTPSDQAAPEAEAIMKTLQDGGLWEGEFPVRRKDGSTFVAFVSDTPIFDQNGDMIAIVGVSHDAETRRR